MVINLTDANAKRVRQALQVARYYYINNLDQVKIAKEMGLSRPTVSRLLQFARDNDYVKIEIKDPFEDAQSLEAVLKEKFTLKKVIVVYSANDYDAIMDSLGRAGAAYLKQIVTDHAIIGITWGKTLHAVSSYLLPNETTAADVKIVQLKGGVSHSLTKNYSTEVTRRFSEAFHAEVDVLPLPVIFDRPETRDIVISDRHIQYVIDQGKKANIALFTVGTVLDKAMLFNLDYLSEKEIATLKKEAVGDISSRFITKDGQIADANINARTIGIELSELKSKEHSILIAGGIRKIPAIKAALLGKYANTLIIDDNTARQLLEDCE